ncbi:hypothetical protein [Novosphingobium sp.]|jgi:predicted Zn-dependent peptidase|uniref:hypothetical protein n=1 Tax=Novosphingobium sp. TaxID=1874826 RepID=UPI00333E43DB
MAEPQRARAVLSTEDFKLIREAVLHYIKHIEDTPESVKFSNLYHRLGSALGR